jgi:uncharacterized membrane protein YeiH
VAQFRFPHWLTEFELPPAFSLLAYFTFGITGALAGVKRGYDVIGVTFLALITAGGGGLIRDGILISRGPPSILTDTSAMLAVLAAAIVTMLLHKHVERLARTIAFVDALGLGPFAVHGVQRSMEAGLSVPAVVLGGTITAVGGGLMRDILVREEPLLFKPGQFYSLVAILGCCLFVALLRLGWTTPNLAALITSVAVFVTRMLAIRFNWRTRALYRVPLDPTT